MPINSVFMELFGTESQLENLYQQWQPDFIANPRRLQNELFYAAVSILKLEEAHYAAARDDQTIDTICEWLDEKGSLLRECNARKVVEIQNAILLGCGSDGYRLPHQLLARLVSLQCELTVQSTRVVRATERDNR